jgi:hypothetical protein
MTTATGIPGVLAGTQPWVRLMSILGFISAGLMILSGVGMLIFGMAQLGGGAEAFAIGIIYPLFGILYMVPSLYLFRYATRIAEYLRGNQEIQLELALDSQRSFWKFVGILSVIGIAIAILGIVAAILIPTLLLVRGG